MLDDSPDWSASHSGLSEDEQRRWKAAFDEQQARARAEGFQTHWHAQAGASAGLDLDAWSAARYHGEPPPIQWLIEGTIPLGVPAMVAAQGDTGKSMLLLDAGCRIAYGEGRQASPIFGGRVARQGSVVILTAEDNQAEVHRRINAVDPHGARHAERGDRLKVVPLPDAGGPVPLVEETRNGLKLTDHYRRIADQLARIDDLALVVFDPLQAFVLAGINEDPAAGQFVCSQLAKLAARTKATIVVAHHMKKANARAPITSLSEAREAVRGTSAIVDGLRLVYALWPAEETQARQICGELRIAYEPNRIVLGGVVKANGQARRVMTTYVRGRGGLLIDRSAEVASSAPRQETNLRSMVEAIRWAAAAGQPFTKTGQGGVYAQRSRLPAELQSIGKHSLESLAQKALDEKLAVIALGPGSLSAKWLDVPGGPFALGIGEFVHGVARDE